VVMALQKPAGLALHCAPAAALPVSRSCRWPSTVCVTRRLSVRRHCPACISPFVSAACASPTPVVCARLRKNRCSRTRSLREGRKGLPLVRGLSGGHTPAHTRTQRGRLMLSTKRLILILSTAYMGCNPYRQQPRDEL